MVRNVVKCKWPRMLRKALKLSAMIGKDRKQILGNPFFEIPPKITHGQGRKYWPDFLNS